MKPIIIIALAALAWSHFRNTPAASPIAPQLAKRAPVSAAAPVALTAPPRNTTTYIAPAPNGDLGSRFSAKQTDLTLGRTW